MGPLPIQIQHKAVSKPHLGSSAYIVLVLLLTSVSCEDGRRDDGSAQVCFVAHVFFEAPVRLENSEHLLEYALFYRSVQVVLGNAPGQRAQNVHHIARRTLV